jgi:hypothetical protein
MVMPVSSSQPSPTQKQAPFNTYHTDQQIWLDYTQVGALLRLDTQFCSCSYHKMHLLNFINEKVHILSRLLRRNPFPHAISTETIHLFKHLHNLFSDLHI